MKILFKILNKIYYFLKIKKLILFFQINKIISIIKHIFQSQIHKYHNQYFKNQTELVGLIGMTVDPSLF